MIKMNTIKKLYHGSACYFDAFDFCYARSFKDFGKGFYLTSDFAQAQKWAQNKAGYKNKTYIYCYKVSPVAEYEWNILELLQYDKQWIDFISKSRMEGLETDYDIIYDRIADSQYTQIADTLQKYVAGKISAEKAISRIRWNHSRADQYCFKNERSLTLLKDRTVIVQYKDQDGRWKQ